MYKKEIIFKCLLLLAILVLVICNMSEKLVSGGRWGIGLFLGGIDNWLSGGPIYNDPNLGINTGPIYGPGGVLVAVISRFIFGYGAETAMIIFGCIPVILLLTGFASIVKCNNISWTWRLTIFSCIYFLGFTFARFYVYEWHPDLPALSCWVWGVILLDRFLTSRKKLPILSSVVLFYIAGIFKANVVFLFIGLGIYALSSKKINQKDKYLIILGELVAGICVLLTMLMVDNCMYNSVSVMGGHPFDTFETYIMYLKGSIFDNIEFVSLLIITIALFFLHLIKLEHISEKMWLSSVLPWFLFGLLGAAKVGSNAGNFDVSIIVFMPLILLSVSKIIYLTKKCFNTIKIFNNTYKIVVGPGIAIICLIIIGLSSEEIIENYKLFKIRLDNQKNFASWISSKHYGENLAFNSSYYELLNGASVHKKTDLFLAGHYSYGNIIDARRLQSLSQNDEWDVIITYPEFGEEAWPELFENYTKLKETEYPPVNGVEVYVKNYSMEQFDKVITNE